MKFRSIVLLFIVSLFLCGCRKDDGPFVPPVSQTLLIYMVADNDMGQKKIDKQNLEKIYSAATEKNFNGGHLIVYLDTKDGSPELFEIVPGSKGKATKKMLKNYGEHNSASGETLRSVINDVRELAPAASYGLVFWSHGTGWLPNSMRKYAFINMSWSFNASNGIPLLLSRTFGDDNSQCMEISDMVLALPDNMFEYIIFDACFMGEIEVAHMLKDKTHYLIASPAEILLEGMPYDLILADCFAGRLEAVCQKYYNYYQEGNGAAVSATIALYDCTQIDALAKAIKPILQKYRAQIQTMNISDIQYYDRNISHTMLDMLHIVDKLEPNKADPLRIAFEHQLDRFVLQKYSTSRIMESIDVQTYCGVSMYVPLSAYNDLTSVYYNNTWYKAAYNN